MAKANFLTDADGNKMYPYAHADATYTNEGKVLGTEFSAIKTKADNLETNKANKNNVLSTVNDCNLSTNASDIAAASTIKELNTSKPSSFTGSGYQSISGIAYNPTTKKLGLKVGATNDILPFSGNDRTYIVKKGEIQSVAGITIQNAYMSYDSANKLLKPTNSSYNAGIAVSGSNLSKYTRVVFIGANNQNSRFYSNGADRPNQGSTISAYSNICNIGSYTKIWASVSSDSNIVDMWLE